MAQLLCDGFEIASPITLSSKLYDLFQICSEDDDKLKVFGVFLKFLSMDDYIIISTLTHTSNITNEIFLKLNDEQKSNLALRLLQLAN